MFPAERDLVEQWGEITNTSVPLPVTQEWCSLPGPVHIMEKPLSAVESKQAFFYCRGFKRFLRSPNSASLKTVGVWVLAAVGAGLVGQWQGIISLYLLIQMTLNGVHLVSVKLHQEWFCPTPTTCANRCSHSTCLLLFLVLFWEWQLQEWLLHPRQTGETEVLNSPLHVVLTPSLVITHRENFRGVEELALMGAGNQLII